MAMFGNGMRAGCAAFLFGLTVVLAGCSEEGPKAPAPQGVKTEIISRDGGTDGKDSVFQGEGTDRQESSAQGEGTDRKESSAQGGETGKEESPAQGEGTADVKTSRSEGGSVSLAEMPQYVFQTGDGHLLLLGNGVSLMDVNTLEVTRRREDTGLGFSFCDMSSCKAAAAGDGYLVIGNYVQMKDAGNGMLASSEAPQLKMVRFDRELNVLEALDIGEATGAEREIDMYGFADNGRKLFCASMSETFLYDLETGTRTEYPLNEGKLHGIYGFGCMESEGKIIFVAAYDNGSSDYHQHVLGSLRLDGTDLQYERQETREWGEIWGFQDFALIEDGRLHESGERGSAFYYGTGGEIREYALADENTSIQPSGTGKYFAVQSREWTADGHPAGYTVRVYESESGGLIREISCPLSEIGEDTMLWQCIVSEEASAVFLLMCDRETFGDARFQIVKL